MVMNWLTFILGICFLFQKINSIDLDEIYDKMIRLINKTNKSIQEYAKIASTTNNATKEDFFLISQYKANYLLHKINDFFSKLPDDILSTLDTKYSIIIRQKFGKNNYFTQILI